MPNTNTCWECKHNTLKLKVLVPHDRTIKEYVRKTGNFQSDIVAVVKENQGRYTVWFRSDSGDLKLVTFNMLHACALRIEREKTQAKCPYHTLSDEQKLISSITYSRQTVPEVAEAVRI